MYRHYDLEAIIGGTAAETTSLDWAPNLQLWDVPSQSWKQAVDTCTGADRFEELVPEENKYSVR